MCECAGLGVCASFGVSSRGLEEQEVILSFLYTLTHLLFL